jgi:hypothetical protein
MYQVPNNGADALPVGAIHKTVGALGLLMAVTGLFLVSMGVAQAVDIPPTGEPGDSCVEFLAGETGTQSPVDYPDVDFTIDSWDADNRGVTFTISGLTADQEVYISIKSGQDVEVFGPFPNGEHHVDTISIHDNSNVRLCVFDGTTTTSTTAATSTTGGSTTTTTGGSTTTTGGSTSTTGSTTTTTEGSTTTTAQVLPTVITTAATVADDELPFTGLERDTTLGIGVVLLALGAGLLTVSRRVDTN